MRSRGIESLAPPSQLGERLCLELALELHSLKRINFRRGEKRVHESFDIEACSSDDQWHFSHLARAGDPFIRFARPSGRRVTLFRSGDIDPVVRHACTLLARWLGGSDFEVAIDLPRIRADDRRIVRLAELQCDRGLAGASRTADDAQPIACQSAALPRPT